MVYAAAPTGYYSGAEGKNKGALLAALEDIVGEHKALGYGDLWDLYYESDVTAEGYIWDMYSTAKFTPGKKQCGNYSKVGDCYNREHSFPKSWFDDRSPMYSDAFHIYPTDGKVNGQRSNYPYGECANGSSLASNGSVKALGRLGSSSFSGYSGTVFEPDDQYKGDFARSYFYMAVAYNSLIDDWDSPQLAGNSYPCFSSWSVSLLMKWHREDPVSEKEINRNEVVYAWQKNRNPFIDHPELAEYVWGNKKDEGWTPSGSAVVEPMIVSPSASSVYDFGTIAVNKSVSMSVPLKAEGLTEELTVRVSGAHFSVTPNEVLVADANKGVNLTIMYAPTYAGSHIAKLQIYNGEVSTEVELKGQCTDGISALNASNVTYDGFTARWTDVDNGGTYAFTVYESDATTIVDGFPVNVSSNAEKYVVSGLDYETTYYYQLSCGERKSNMVKVTTASPNRILTFNNVPEGGLKFSAALGEPSAVQEIGIYTEYIAEKINVSVIGNFEISMDNSSWSNTLSNIDADGETFYLRMKATANSGEYSGVLSLNTASFDGTELDIKGVVATPRAFFEDFEAMDVSGYATGTYQGSACKWKLTNVGAYGRAAQDRFKGTKALCTGKSGSRSAEMVEDKINGIGILSFVAAPFSNDDAATLKIKYSIDGGNTWTEVATEVVSVKALTEYTYPINKAGNVRVKFEQTAGKRLNIDDVSITDYVTPSAVDMTQVGGWIAYGVKGGIEVNTSKNITMEVYSIDGDKVNEMDLQPGVHHMHLVQGVYILVSGEVGKKVIVK